MSHRIRAPKIFALATLATLAGCVLIEKMTKREEVFGFNHAIHVEEGMDCTDCHFQVEDADDPGLPSLPQCMLCHEEIDADKPPERRIDTLFDGKKFRATKHLALPDEVIFSHETHANSDFACDACHTGIEQNEHVTDLPKVTMDDCRACHAKAGVAQEAAASGPAGECATCHTVVNTEWRPPTHEQAWLKRHGQVFRSGSDDPVDRCSVCHDSNASCNACHQEVAPESHTNFWRRRGHGVAASLDRQSCETCHRTDSCLRCHEEQMPISHHGSFGGTMSTHCLTCHFPLKTEGCIVCHKSTPSHMQATPLPTSPAHSPGLNCRQCHGITAPLPHVDKGDECILCHR